MSQFSLENLKNLTGDELQREIGKQLVFIWEKLNDIYQLMIEWKAQTKEEK
jgi:hypothetical protein